MTCRGCQDDRIPNGYYKPTGVKFEFTDGRIRECRACDTSYWIGGTLWCGVDNVFVPGKAREESEKCSLNKWKR